MVVRQKIEVLDGLIAWRGPTQERDVIAKITEQNCQAEYVLEVGIGGGEYLIEQAKMNPHRIYFGIDVAWESVKRALVKREKANLKNVFVLWGDAIEILYACFRPRSLSAIYSLFPCPWPKRRHTKNRLFLKSTLPYFNSRLMDGGQLQVVTDHRDFHDQMIEPKEWAESGFEVQSRVSPAIWGTKYQKKWQAQGQEDFYIVDFEKQQHYDLGWEEDSEVRKPMVKEWSADRFELVSLEGPVGVECKDFYFDAKKDVGHVYAIVSDQHLCQHCWVQIRPHRGEYQISVAPGCSIIPTKSIQQCLDHVADLVVQSQA